MFEAVVSQEGSVRTIRLNGEFDIAVFPEITTLFDESLSNGYSAVKIDLGGLTFIDSTGLRALLNASFHAEEHGGNLTILPGTAQVQKVFEIAGLLDRLPFAGA